MMRRLIALVTVLLLVLPVLAGAGPALVAVGARLPDVRLDGLNGASRQLASYRGRPLLINVWASWCGPCRAETASLERLAWRDEARGFAIIGVSTDDYRANASEWLKRSNATISHYLDHDLELETLLGAARLPLTVLVDANGIVVERVYGAREWDAPQELQRLRRAFGRPPLAPGRL